MSIGKFLGVVAAALMTALSLQAKTVNTTIEYDAAGGYKTAQGSFSAGGVSSNWGNRPDWITGSPSLSYQTKSGVCTCTVGFTVAANDTSSERSHTFTLTVGSDTWNVTLHQAGAVGSQDPEDDPDEKPEDTTFKLNVDSDGNLVSWSGTLPSKLVFPSTVKAIRNDQEGANLFCYRDELTEVVFSSSIELIDLDCFCGCENLEKVTFAEGLKTIGNNAFGDCPKLTTIDIPASVTSVEPNAFMNTGISTVTFHSTSTVFAPTAFAKYERTTTYDWLTVKNSTLKSISLVGATVQMSGWKLEATGTDHADEATFAATDLGAFNVTGIDLCESYPYVVRAITQSVDEDPDIECYTRSGYAGQFYLSETQGGKISKSEFAKGSEAYLCLNLRNVGTVVAPKGVDVVFYVNGKQFSSYTTDTEWPINEYRTISVKVSFGSTPVGTYTLTAVVNPNKTVSESDYSNNTATFSFSLVDDAIATLNRSVSAEASSGTCQLTETFPTAGSYVLDGSSMPSWVTGVKAHVVSGSSDVTVNAKTLNQNLVAGATATLYFTLTENTTGAARSWTYTITGPDRIVYVKVTQNPASDPDPLPTPIVKADTFILYARVYNKDTGKYLEDADGVLAAFDAAGQCVGKTKLSQGPNSQLFQLTVAIDSSADKGITLQYWSSAMGLIDKMGVTYDGSQPTRGTIASPLVIKIPAEDTCEITLNQGYTWISSFVLPTDASFATVFKDVTFGEEDVIKSSDGSATYYGGKWYPSPENFKLTPGRAYAVKKSTSGSATVKVSGTAAAKTLQVSAGWNWIGPTSSEKVAVSDLVHSAGFVDEVDIINSASTASSYYGAWWGDLTDLLPGVGYKAKFAKAGTVSFGAVADNVVAGEDELFAVADDVKVTALYEKEAIAHEKPGWTVETQPDTIIGYYEVTDAKTQTKLEVANSMLAAFAEDGTCRGVATLGQGPKGKLFQITIGIASSSDTNISFKAWNAGTGDILDINEKIASVAGIEKVGAINAPATLTYGEKQITYYTVTFDLNGHGTRTGGGTLSQQVESGKAATKPEFTVESGWAFVEWDKTFDNVTGNLTVTAQYRAESIPDEFGPWKESDVVNSDMCAPTYLQNMTVSVYGKAIAAGDVVAVYRTDTGKLCGLGKADGDDGTITLIYYAPQGTTIHFAYWQKGTSTDTFVDAPKSTDLTAVKPGSFVEGAKLIITLDIDLTMKLGSSETWHTVSFNVLPSDADPTPANLFKDVVDKIVSVNNNGIKYWMPGKGGSLDKIEIGAGYWVKVKEDNVSWTVTGRSAPKTTIAVKQGWNLIGYTPETAEATAVVLKSAFASGLLKNVTYGISFYPGKLTTMSPGLGYWAYATKDGTLTYDEAVAADDVVDAIESDEDAQPLYGPWGDGSGVINSDMLAPTYFTDLSVSVDGAPITFGDVVAVYRKDTGALCGLGRAEDDTGLVTIVYYAPEGTKLHFQIWPSESGTENPTLLDADADIDAPKLGTFNEGISVTVTTKKEDPDPEEEIPNWAQRIVTQPDTMIGYFVVSNAETGALIESDGSMLGAFVGEDECRVAARIMEGPNGKLFQVTIGVASSTEKGIALKVYDAENGVTNVLSRTLDAGVEKYGSIFAPEVLVLGSVPVPEQDEYRAGEQCEIEAPETTLTGKITWSAKNLPAGLKINSKTGVISGTPTMPGKYAVKVTAKSGKKKETSTIELLIGHYQDETLPLEEAYDAQVGVMVLCELGDEFADAKVTGLPSGLKFAAKATTDKVFGEIAAGTVYGVPSKSATNCVIFTVTKTETVNDKSQKVTHKASATFAVAAAPTWAVGTFNGYVGDGSGSATLTVSSSGKVSGKIVAEGRTWTFTASGYCPVDGDADLDALTIVSQAKSGTLAAYVEFIVTSDGVTGAIAGDEISASLKLWRNEWKDKGATDKLGAWAGLYTVQISSGDSGYGYLSLTLDAKGNCKATGKLPDGTAVSMTLPIIWVQNAADDEDDGYPIALWQMSPSAYKGGYVGGLLRWEQNSSASAMVTGDEIAWVSCAPTASVLYGDGFSRKLSALGAYYSKLANLSEYYSKLAFVADTPEFDASLRTTDRNATGKKTVATSSQVVDASVLECWNNLTVSLNSNGSAFVVDAGKATKPVQDAETKEWSYAGANDAALTMSFTKATGIFKGSFLCWYDYVSAVDNTKDLATETISHASKKVSYEGIMVLGETLRGFYLWNRTGAYEDAKGNAKTYSYKESKPVVFEISE